MGMVHCATCVQREEDESQRLVDRLHAMGEQIQELRKELADERAEFAMVRREIHSLTPREAARASYPGSASESGCPSPASSRFSCADVRLSGAEAPATRLFTVEPETGWLSFDMEPGAAQVNRSFRLINQSLKFVAFKIRTSAPNCYRVKPGNGTMAAGESRAVEVLLDLEVLLAEDGSLAAARKHRFSVRGTAASSPHALTAEQWAALPKDNMQEQRLKVEVHEVDAQSSTSASSSHGNTARGSPAVPPRSATGGLTPMGPLHLRSGSDGLTPRTPGSMGQMTPRELWTPRELGGGLSTSPPNSGRRMA